MALGIHSHVISFSATRNMQVHAGAGYGGAIRTPQAVP